MKRLVYISTLFVLYPLFGGAWALMDLRGNKISLDHPPSRIVSLAPNLTDLVVDLKQEGRLVGVTRFSTWVPPSEVSIVGDVIRWNVEAVVAARADLVLVLASGSMKERAKYLANALRAPMAVFRIESLHDLKSAASDLASTLGAVHQLPPWIETGLAEENSPATSENPTAVLLTSLAPLIASGPDTYEGDLMRIGGYRNVISGKRFRRRSVISAEELLRLNPDYIFVTEHSEDATDFPKTLRFTSAYRLGRIQRIPADVVLQPGLRAPEGILKFRAGRPS